MLSISQLEVLRSLIQKRTGIFYPKNKDFLLQARVSSLCKDGGFRTEAEVIKEMKNDDSELWGSFIKSFTTNHTFFFREVEHYDLLIKEIRSRNLEKPTIWIAAASTGEELYTMEIRLIEAGIRDYFIMVSDINKQNLMQVKKALYPAGRLKFVPENLLRRYFTLVRKPQEEDHYQVKDILKTGFVLKTLNLTDPLRFEQKFDFVFCRNVLMYFPAPVQKQVVRMTMDNLNPGGCLFIGHSESLGSLQLGHEMDTVDVAVYRKKVRNG